MSPLVRFILLYCKKYECTWIVELIFNNNKNILVILIVFCVPFYSSFQTLKTTLRVFL